MINIIICKNILERWLFINVKIHDKDIIFFIIFLIYLIVYISNILLIKFKGDTVLFVTHPSLSTILILLLRTSLICIPKNY